MDIREAVPEDNDALQALQAKCPQGTDLVATVINTPDFFSRAKAYKIYKVYVACEGKRILGSTACGFKDVIVNGNVKRVGYGFQAFVAPIFAITILASAITATLGMIALNKLPRLHHPLFDSERFAKGTDGGFFICIEANDGNFDLDQTVEFLESAGALNVEVV